MSDRAYCYPPDYTVLKNKLNLRDADLLARFERRLVTARIAQEIPKGDFDLDHLKAIHRHLFQDLYTWAGELRTVEIAKGDQQFQLRRYMEVGVGDVHRRIVASRYLSGLPADLFAQQAGEILGDLNYVHPFREGNGRTQLLYLDQLASRAGHPLDLTKIEEDTWMSASKEAHEGRYEAMSRCVARAIEVDDGGEQQD